MYFLVFCIVFLSFVVLASKPTSCFAFAAFANSQKIKVELFDHDEVTNDDLLGKLMWNVCACARTMKIHEIA